MLTCSSCNCSFDFLELCLLASPQVELQSWDYLKLLLGRLLGAGDPVVNQIYVVSDLTGLE